MFARIGFLTSTDPEYTHTPCGGPSLLPSSVSSLSTLPRLLPGIPQLVNEILVSNLLCEPPPGTPSSIPSNVLISPGMVTNSRPPFSSSPPPKDRSPPQYHVPQHLVRFAHELATSPEVICALLCIIAAATHSRPHAFVVGIGTSTSSHRFSSL